MFAVFPAGRVRKAGGAVGAAVKAASDARRPYRAAVVSTAWVGHELGVDVTQPCCDVHYLGPAIETDKLCKWMIAVTCVADFSAEPVDEVHVTKRRCHDVRHDVRSAYCVDHVFRSVPEPEHAIPATVVDHTALERHNPWTLPRDRDVRIDLVAGVEVYKSVLDPGALGGFVKSE